ncbi:MAG: HNH endonuclease, partial [Deltaproteobacteria bacterium]|nr:HNH endonuclease [Deltaproteobacteria bacterium]
MTRAENAPAISGKLRHEVLKRAGFHCDLCGVSADECALEVEHILPREHGGSDELENLQALCSRCSAGRAKGDDADFRKVRESYDERKEGCRFCQVIAARMVGSNALSYAIRDG